MSTGTVTTNRSVDAFVRGFVAGLGLVALDELHRTWARSSFVRRHRLQPVVKEALTGFARGWVKGLAPELVPVLSRA